MGLKSREFIGSPVSGEQQGRATSCSSSAFTGSAQTGCRHRQFAHDKAFDCSVKA